MLQTSTQAYECTACVWNISVVYLFSYSFEFSFSATNFLFVYRNVSTQANDAK